MWLIGLGLFETIEGVLKFRLGSSSYFPGFEISPNSISLGWKILELYFWVMLNFCYFLGSYRFLASYLAVIWQCETKGNSISFRFEFSRILGESIFKGRIGTFYF